MSKVVIIKSTVTSIHRTKVSSCEEVVMEVVRDDSIPGIDPYCTHYTHWSTHENPLDPHPQGPGMH